MNKNFCIYIIVAFIFIGTKLCGQVTPPGETKPIPESNGLYLSSYDEPQKLSRPEAVCACQNKGDGWRLPTAGELQQIATKSSLLTTGLTYWSIDKVDGKLEFYSVGSENGKLKKEPYNTKNSIRCVWSSTEFVPISGAMEVAAESDNKPSTEPVTITKEEAQVANNEVSNEPQTKNKDAEKTHPQAKDEKEELPKESANIFSAKFPYKHSLGIIGGNITGFSYKTFVKDHFAIELDLAACQVFVYFDKFYMGIPVLNLNFLYQGQFTKGLYGIAGGGGNIGFDIINNDVWWGLCTLFGLEYVFEKPVSIQFDFRPGFGQMDFAWALCLSVRYVFK
ncbi:MAG: hypothetical protein IJT04_06890 [Bacteroidales bacterium]|nr:hypothetical protein [Bacteroidales bacterium]